MVTIKIWIFFLCSVVIFLWWLCDYWWFRKGNYM